MANPERGEHTLTIAGREWLLRLTTNAACELEERSGKLLDELVLQLERGSVSALRWILWAALQDRHSAEIRTPADVGHLIDAGGGIPELVKQTEAFLALNRPEVAGLVGTNGSGTTRPPDAQSATNGGVSTSTPVLSD